MMKKILFSSIALVFSFAFINAQPVFDEYSPETILKVADKAFAENDKYTALEWYEKYYKETRDKDIAKKIADLCFDIRDYRKAERWYSRLVDLRPTKRNPVNQFLPAVRYDYAQVLKLNGNYPDAISEFQQYLQEGQDPHKIAMAKIALTGAEMAREMQDIFGLSVDNSGKKINTKYSEYSPVLAPGDQMYFTAYRSDEILVVDGKNSDKLHAKAYSSTRKGGENEWTEAQALGTNINREGFHTGNLTLTKDGKGMFFTRVVLEGNVVGTSKIYYSEMTSDGWGDAAEVAGVNGDFLAKQPAVGELYGKEVLFFVSNMDGGHGGFDIYYSTRTGDGQYADPVNLGNVVNTIGDEETPYYIDGNLFFSSTGHPGMGGFDAFNTVWDGSSWSSPTNMGRGYNSPVDDLYLSLDEEGYNGFIVSNREGTRSVHSKTCCSDIWTIKKDKVVLGLVASAFSDGKPLKDVKFQLVEMIDNTPGETDKKSTVTNSANFSVAKEMSYMVIGEKEGFFPDTTYFNTVGVSTSKTFEENVNLRPLPPPPPEDEWEEYTIDQPIRLNNIYYALDDAEILPAAESDLQIIHDLLVAQPEIKVIELGSHTDSQGVTGYNKKLSQRRANSAMDWLINKGIDASRMKAVGYGESMILNQCVNGVKCGDEEHQFNRRTEFKIVEGPKVIKISKKRLKKKG